MFFVFVILIFSFFGRCVFIVDINLLSYFILFKYLILKIFFFLIDKLVFRICKELMFYLSCY